MDILHLPLPVAPHYIWNRFKANTEQGLIQWRWGSCFVLLRILRALCTLSSFSSLNLPLTQQEEPVGGWKKEENWEEDNHSSLKDCRMMEKQEIHLYSQSLFESLKTVSHSLSSSVLHRHTGKHAHTHTASQKFWGREKQPQSLMCVPCVCPLTTEPRSPLDLWPGIQLASPCGGTRSSGTAWSSDVQRRKRNWKPDGGDKDVWHKTRGQSALGRNKYLELQSTALHVSAAR